MEICPSCGNDTEKLNDYTGWCNSCTGVTPTSEVLFCVRCSSAFVSDKKEFICHACRVERWANEIERIMVLAGVSYSRAEQLVALENRASCLCCGDLMPHATKGRHLFCSKNKCRSASRRLKYLRLNKGMAHEDALQLILAELAASEVAA